MTEEQQIEIWAQEFDDKYFHSAQIKLDKGSSKYRVRDSHIWNREAESLCVKFNNMLDVWIEARRSMPAIEIPSYDLHHYAPVRNITAQMDDAGIKYKIKL